MTTKLGERILALVEQGKSTREIMDLCETSQSTALKYRRQYIREHPEEEIPDPNWKPKVSEKERRLRATAISAEEVAKARNETKVGDTVPLLSLKLSEKSEKKSVNGHKATGKVVLKSRHFCIVRLPSGITESVLWVDLVKSRRGGVRADD